MNSNCQQLINMTDIFISPAEDLYVNDTSYLPVRIVLTMLTHSYLVMDCCMTDLHALIQSRSKPLEEQFVQFFTYQLLVCLPGDLEYGSVADNSSEG